MLWTVLLVTMVLILVAIAISLLGGKVEVEPKTARIYKNTLTGNTGAILPGVGFIRPWQKEIRTISLRNEPADPKTAKVNTADPIEVGVDYVIKEFWVLDNQQAIRLAFTAIDYDKRLTNTELMISIALNNSLGRRNFNEIYDDEEGKGAKRDMVTEIEGELNNTLLVLEKEWGLHVKLEIREIEFPDSISEAKEDRIKAKYEGEALRRKAEAAGTGPNVRDVIIADAFIDALRTFRGGKQ